MSADLSIRGECSADHVVIDALVRRAYAAVPYSDHREHLMVAQLRESSAFVPELSLLAERAGVAIGHVLLVRVEVGGMASPPRLATLAPLSVVPEFQRQGVGSALVHAAHDRARQLGFAGIVLVGPPEFYRRFGYGPLAAAGLTLPFAVPEAQRMFISLSPDTLEGCAGTVVYPAAWLDH